MQCRRCHHTDEIHKPSDESRSLLKLGACQIPDCHCQQFLDPIPDIDEDLL